MTYHTFSQARAVEMRGIMKSLGLRTATAVSQAPGPTGQKQSLYMVTGTKEPGGFVKAGINPAEVCGRPLPACARRT